MALPVRADVLIRTLAYYVTWHMQQRLASILFTDDSDTAKAARPSPVAAAQRSPSALAKAMAKVTGDGQPVHSFATLLAGLATISANQIQPAVGQPGFTLITTPTPVQRRLRATWRLSPPRVRVARRDQITARFRRQAYRHVPRGGTSG